MTQKTMRYGGVASVVLGISTMSYCGLRDHRPGETRDAAFPSEMKDIVRSSTEDGESPYVFDERANQLVRLMFPRYINNFKVSNAYLSRKQPARFSSLQAVLSYVNDSLDGNYPTHEPLDTRWQALDSYWRTVDPSRGRKRTRSGDLNEAERLIASLAKETSFVFRNIREKALFQRDVVAVSQTFQDLIDDGQDDARVLQLRGIADGLTRLLRRVTFTSPELSALRDEVFGGGQRPPFTTTCTFDLKENYLPDVILKKNHDWFEIPFDAVPARHFIAYGGRCFVRTFLRAPGMSQSAIRDYLNGIARTFGIGATLSAEVPPLPSGTETVLLRTFGVFMEDGSYADTNIPEEVLVRVFKYRKDQVLDMSTSDYRGTMLYQYKMRRAKLIREPGTLGLERLGEDSVQFYGFFNEIPDLSESRDETLTTMRANCVGCHSELLYGASTVYSFCRTSELQPGAVSSQGGRLSQAGDMGWLIYQEPLQSIQRALLESTAMK